MAVLSSLALAPHAPAAEQPPGPAADGQRPTLVVRPAEAPWWLSGQINVITQGHLAFPAAYSGDQSLRPQAEQATSYVGTLQSGFRLTATTELIVHVEMAGGNGVSSAYGMGGFFNLDVVRNPTLSREPYLARLLVHQMIPLSLQWEEVARGPLQASARVPVRRIDLWAGKLGTVDFFDRNSVGSDSHLQFLNWTVDNNGAFDYAADTRGYTYGLMVAYESPATAARLGLMLMPKTANGSLYDWDLRHARGQNLEVERRYQLGGRRGVVRALVFLNNARMGRYRAAIDSFIADPATDNACRAATEAEQGRRLPGPVIECSRAEGRTKFGVGLNAEQEVGRHVRLFARLGWNDGRNETFAYTEVDSTLAAGLDLDGALWRRGFDRIGLAAVSNGLSADHRQYLALGGKGFLLGDGRLSYGRETIVEGYYTALVGCGLSLSADLQLAARPGYNRDRGPAVVGALRLHLEI
jgi:hypothetical protein